MTHTFKPKFNAMIVFYLGSLIGVGSGILLICLLINSSYFWMKILLTMFFILTIYFIYITVIYPLKTRLSICDTGILYKHPYYSVFCSWKDIEEIELTNDHLVLKYDQSLLHNKSRHVRESVNNTIPISNFVKSYRTRNDWDEDLILSTLKKEIPISDSEIQKYFR